MKRNLIILGIILLVIAGITIYFSRNQNKTTGSASAQESPKFTVKKNKLTETLTISGEIAADEHVSLFFPLGGKLSWVGVKEGDFVKKYQGIASLDQRDLQKKLESSLNTYMISRWDFEQTKDDNKDADVTSGELGEKLRRIVDKAQFNLNNSVINVELQSLAKEMAYMYSPIEGIVTKVGGQFAGANIAATQTYEVVNPQTVYFLASADQTEVPLISVGDTAKITLDPYENETMTGVVKSIAFTPKTGDTGTSYEIKIDFGSVNDLLKYRLGMTGDAEFVTKEIKNVYAIPLNYVTTENKKKYVYVLKDGKEVKTEVQLGEEGDSDVAVKSGIKEGDVLVEKK
ncbi:MAG: efflux RND transporter periplasmic adaptor subunit [Patescibacteria group bacterium]